MKKIICIMIILLGFSFDAKSQLEEQKITNTYNRFFIYSFGEIHPDQSWGFKKIRKVTRVLVEDLSAQDNSDFDFNDLVFDVEFESVNKAKITIQAVGTTLPIEVAGKEAHKAMGYSPETLINTSGENKINPASFVAEGDFGGNPKNIPVKVQRGDIWVTTRAMMGEPPSKIAVPGDFVWCNERTVVTNNYNLFNDWVKGGVRFYNDTDENFYKLNYIINDSNISSYEVEFGAVTPIEAPEREGYTFSGWSELPSTMPAKDVTVTGSFTINKYKLTYKVDGEVYKEYDVEYGATITPETAPTKEGYTFSGWSEIPKSMPSHDVTITGTFTKIGIGGKCGENLKWTYLQESKTITISGTGEMYAFYLSESRPWRDIEKIETLNVEEGVTSIGASSFEGRSDLKNVNLPSSLKRIEEAAFQNCYGINSIIIPNNVVLIDNYCFYHCTSLSSVTLSSGMTNIRENSFRGCNSLTSIEIPEGIETIQDHAFQECTALTSLTLPTSITSIGSESFQGCVNLASIYIKDLTSWCNLNFGYGRFSEIQYDLYLNKEKVKNLIIPDDVKTIGDGVFSNCSSIESLVITDNVTAIGINSFSECNNLKSITIGRNVSEISEQAFAGNEKLESILIPQNVSSITGNIFSGCKNLSSIKVESGNAVYDSRYNCNAIIETASNKLIAGCTNTVIPDNIKIIGHNSFYLLPNLTSISIPISVEIIEQGAFGWCSNLKSIILPDNLKEIGSGAFIECKSLTDIIIPDKITKLSGYLFEACTSLSSVVIGRGVTRMGFGVFYDCTSLAKIVCLCSDPPIVDAKDAFRGVDLSIPLYVPYGSATKYKTADIWRNFINIIEGDGYTKYKLIYYVDNTEYKSYEYKEGEAITPEPVPVKEGYTFSGWSEIPSTMPANDVTVTGSFTINKYKLIYKVDGEVYKEFDVEYGATITPETAPTKEGYTFSGWSDIPSTMPAKDVTITGSFTINKYKLTYIVDGEIYKEYDIEYGATITPEPAPTKEGYEFSGWSDIPSTMPANNVEITGSFKQIDYKVEGATYEISGEGTVSIKGGDHKGNVEISGTVVINGQTYKVTAIAENAFEGNTQITSVTIPEGITTIGSNAFSGCVNMLVINIGKSVSSIGNKAFANAGTSSTAKTRGENSFIVNCYAESVPQTASDAFENSPIATGTLLVNDNIVDAYKTTSPWSGFGKIQGFQEAAGIGSIIIDNPNAHIYDMQGNRIDNLQKGVNIIRLEDGKTKKVIVK